jgi:hypothetical protein
MPRPVAVITHAQLHIPKESTFTVWSAGIALRRRPSKSAPHINDSTIWPGTPALCRNTQECVPPVPTGHPGARPPVDPVEAALASQHDS